MKPVYNTYSRKEAFEDSTGMIRRNILDKRTG